MAIDKAALLARRALDTTKEVELASGDGSVVVRGLTRKEALSVQGVEMDEAEAERKLLSLALVDPKLTEDEIDQWQEHAPAGELVPVTDAVLELSGMTSAITKEAMRRFRE
jgi:hypothetical protein